ncbi:MAG: hypothetical protein JNK05_30680 [Myxococcales bacterium]|nr:hypothetical protein [Myxococcales bacterium]
MTRNAEYYRVGPTQGSPPDGVIAQGTHCELRGSAIGAHELVRTEDGREGYVARDALSEIVDDSNNNLITYYVEKDLYDKLKLAAKTACNFWNKFVQPKQSIVIQLSTFYANSSTIARAYKPVVNNGVRYGRVEFNTKFLVGYTNFETAGTIAHEIGHSLGFGWDDWMTLFDTNTGKFKKDAIARIPALSNMIVETGGGSGTIYSHWSETHFTNELMTGYKNRNERVLPVTIDVMGLLGNTVVESLDSERPLDQLLAETETVLFSRELDLQTIDLTAIVPSEIAEEIVPKP